MVKLIALLAMMILSVPAYSSGMESGKYHIYSSSSLDQEIVLAELFNHYQIIGGRVRVSWQRNDIDESAGQIKTKLAAMGVPVRDIVMDKTMSNSTSGALITMTIERHQFPYACDYHRQDYKLRKQDKTGCALENNIYMSLVDKNKKVF